jgi:hypothetical protein
MISLGGCHKNYVSHYIILFFIFMGKDWEAIDTILLDSKNAL